jgi:hypothetical protein
MALNAPAVAHVMLTGPDSHPDDSYNARRQLIETIAFAAGCTTVDAALLLFWLERIVASARLRDYKVIFLRTPEFNAQYLLFAKIFRANNAEPPDRLVQQITQYLLDPRRYETAIQHTQLGHKLIYGQVAVTIRRKLLPPALIPVFKSGSAQPQIPA